MIDLLRLLFSVIAGMMLGAIFFGGLLWTVQKGILAKHPAFWFFGSMLLRTGIVLVGFYYILGDNWLKLLAGLSGFLVARSLVILLTRDAQQQKEASYAP